MPTLTKTSNATIVTSTQSVQYAGTDVNAFFGGNHIAMIAFGKPSALGTDERVSNAILKCWVKADTTADYEVIDIGMIDSSWGGGNSGYPGMYAALLDVTVHPSLSTGLTEAEVSLNVTPLVQNWASNPDGFSGLYLRCPALQLTRIGATNCTIEFETITQSAAKAPDSVSMSAAVAETSPELIWSGAGGGTNNALVGYEIGYADSLDGISYGNWQSYLTLSMTDTSGRIGIPLPASRGTWRMVRIRTLGAAGDHSLWVAAAPFRYNSAPTPPFVSYPSADDHFTYNKAIRFLVTVGWEADDQLMTLEAPESSPAIKTSSQAPFRRGKQLIIQRSDGGSYDSQAMVPTTLAILARDEMGVAGGTSQRKAYAANPEKMTVDPRFQAGGTQIKAAHINDIRTAVQVLRNVYGVPVTNWAGGDIVAGTTPTSGWAGHVAEIRTAIDAIIQKINTWDDTAEDCLVEVPEWIPITGTQPQAAVMEQLRTVIASI